MKVNHVETKADENVAVDEEVIKQLLILAVVTLSLVIIAFLFSECSGSSGADGSSGSEIEDTSGDTTIVRCRIIFCSPLDTIFSGHSFKGL